MRRILTQKFFNRKAEKVARELIGKQLVRKIHGKERSYEITETESYEGEEDLACHARGGKTKRYEVMYGEAGVFYVYLVYGMHYMLNIVTGKEGHPAAVLIRGIENVNGPGKVTRRLQIKKSLNRKKASRKNKLWFEEKGTKVKKEEIMRTPRIGVDYAGPIWSKKLWRFVKKSQPKSWVAKSESQT